MEYRTSKGKYYIIISPIECYCCNPKTKQIRLEKIPRKIEAILNFAHITKEEYENAYIECLN